jgi:hypothetical protein
MINPLSRLTKVRTELLTTQVGVGPQSVNPLQIRGTEYVYMKYVYMKYVYMNEKETVSVSILSCCRCLSKMRAWTTLMLCVCSRSLLSVGTIVGLFWISILGLLWHSCRMNKWISWMNLYSRSLFWQTCIPQWRGLRIRGCSFVSRV